MLDEMCDKLINLFKGSHDYASVFRIRQEDALIHELRSMIVSRQFLASHGVVDGIRPRPLRLPDHTALLLPEDIRINIFHASGAFIAASRIVADTDLQLKALDEPVILSTAKNILQSSKIVEQFGNKRFSEEIRFEKLWRVKACGTSQNGMRGEPVMRRAVTAYRRYVNDLPIWGRASVSMKFSLAEKVEELAIEWRPVMDEIASREKIIPHPDGARNVVRELQSHMADNADYLQRFQPTFFSVGYFSLPRRQSQGMLAPAYVGMFKTVTGEEFSKLIVVPATSNLYDSFIRRPLMPPAMRVPSRSLTSLSKPPRSPAQGRSREN